MMMAVLGLEQRPGPPPTPLPTPASDDRRSCSFWWDGGRLDRGSRRSAGAADEETNIGSADLQIAAPSDFAVAMTGISRSGLKVRIMLRTSQKVPFAFCIDIP